MTKNIYPCEPYSVSCLPLSKNTHLICETGYIGPLCQTCDHGFAKYGGKKCGPCYNETENKAIIIVAVIGLFCFLAFYVK